MMKVAVKIAGREGTLWAAVTGGTATVDELRIAVVAAIVESGGRRVRGHEHILTRHNCASSDAKAWPLDTVQMKKRQRRDYNALRVRNH